MVRAIVWKEFREQGLIALTLVVLGAGVLVAAATLADPPSANASPADVVRSLGAGRLATLLLAVTAGMVCGGALFAAEREAGTIGFLEALPVSRWELWRAKVVAGTALVAAQVVVVVGTAAGLGLVDSGRLAVQLALSAFHAFCWGLFGSALARTTLGSVGVALPAATLTAFAFLFPVMLLFHNPGSSQLRGEGLLIFSGLMFVTPLAGSALVFTRPDRARAANDLAPGVWAGGLRGSVRPAARPRPAGPPGAGPAPRLGVKALVWLSARQLRGPGAVLSAFALVFGLTLLAPTVQPALYWPPLALAAGVLAGVLVFADEQAGGSARFWGERRLPLGRAWAVKVGAHAALALWLAALLLLPSAVRSQFASGPGVGRGQSLLSGAFRSVLFDDPVLGPQGWKYALAPLAYGFAAGHLCGLVFRKAVVAAGVAGLLGGTAAALWGPSLLAGGVYHWQLWLPPAAVLLTGRLLVRAWAADRLGDRGPLATLAAGVAAAALVQAAGIGYRVAEIPDRPDGEDDRRYVASLPTFEANAGGREFRTAADRFGRRVDEVNPPFERRPAPPPNRRRIPIPDRLERVPFEGWAGDEEMADWLGQVFHFRPAGDADQPWHAVAAGAAGHPTGIFEHPQLLGAGVPRDDALANARRMAWVLVVRGLERQAAGDPAAFVGHLRVALALARNLRNGSIVAALMSGSAVARTALAGTDQWLRALEGRPDLLEAALAAVLEDDRTVLTRALPDGTAVPPVAPDDGGSVPFDPVPHLLAERHLLRELMKGPGTWLPDQLTPPGGSKEAAAPEADLVAFAWTVPWERERTRRLVGLGFESGVPGGYYRLVRGRPGAVFLAPRLPTREELAEFDRQLRVFRRAVALALAVRLYRERRGEYPAALDELVTARYLPAVPADPYDGRPFRYRVSAGETLVYRPRGDRPAPGPGRGFQDPPPPFEIRPGQPVLWSVGPNGTDEGGRNPPSMLGGLPRPDDVVFLVPLPP